MSEFLIYVVLALIFVLLTLKAFSNRNKWKAWIDSNELSAFHCLDEIIDGKKWVGINLELVHSSRVILDKPMPFIAKVNQLCKSQSGSYILLKMIMDARNNSVSIKSKSVLTDESAKSYLEPMMDVYITEFGPVEPA